jgi:hypothetical protein
MSNIREITKAEFDAIIKNAEEIRDCRSAIVSEVAYEITNYDEFAVLEIFDASEVYNLSNVADFDCENPQKIYVSENTEEIHKLFIAKIQEALKDYE